MVNWLRYSLQVHLVEDVFELRELLRLSLESQTQIANFVFHLRTAPSLAVKLPLQLLLIVTQLLQLLVQLSVLVLPLLSLKSQLLDCVAQLVLHALDDLQRTIRFIEVLHMYSRRFDTCCC